MRIAAGVEYDGSAFCGWQWQEGQRTVQADLEKGLTAVASGSSIRVFTAGRTDTGVHALGQVIHFETDVLRPIKAWVQGVNTHLEDDMRVLWAKEVDDQFHARFSAQNRHYRYLIYNSPIRPAVMRTGVTWFSRALDVTLMQQAAPYFLGELDYSSFRSSKCQSKSCMRHVQQVKIKRRGSIISIDIKANAFLHHMVRNMVGVLLAVGTQEKSPEWVKEVLNAKDRTQAGVTAPPFGLYLTYVEYPEKYALPVPDLSRLPIEGWL